MERSNTVLACHEAPLSAVFSLGEHKGKAFLLVFSLFFPLHIRCF